MNFFIENNIFDISKVLSDIQFYTELFIKWYISNINNELTGKEVKKIFCDNFKTAFGKDLKNKEEWPEEFWSTKRNEILHIQKIGNFVSNEISTNSFKKYNLPKNTWIWNEKHSFYMFKEVDESGYSKKSSIRIKGSLNKNDISNHFFDKNYLLKENEYTLDVEDYISELHMQISDSKMITHKRNQNESLKSIKYYGNKCAIHDHNLELLEYTFLKKDGKTPYLEPHHILPLNAQKFCEKNLDASLNIMPLCATCHRKIHNAEESEQDRILEEIAFKFEERNIINFYQMINKISGKNYIDNNQSFVFIKKYL